MPLKREAKSLVSKRTALPAKKKRRTKRKKRATKKPSTETSAAAAAITTPPRKPMGDKVELSPNSLAKCQTCRRKIQQNEPRVGKEVYYAPRKAYYHQYYHASCFEQQSASNDDDTLALNLQSGKSLSQELSLQRQRQAHDHVLLQQRSPLTKSLQDLRTAFAQRLQRPPWLVFDDHTLNRIVLQMPRHRHELLQVSGFKQKRYQSFGRPILRVIQQYKRRHPSEVRDPQTTSLTAESNHDVFVIDDSEDDLEDDDDDEVVVGETLSCEDIVRRKFEDAAAHNYLISIDL